VTLVQHGEWLARQGDVPAAAPLFDEAKPIIGDLRAVPWKERLKRAIARADAATRTPAAAQPIA
jgi:hypothetical protein